MKMCIMWSKVKFGFVFIVKHIGKWKTTWYRAKLLDSYIACSNPGLICFLFFSTIKFTVSVFVILYAIEIQETDICKYSIYIEREFNPSKMFVVFIQIAIQTSGIAF